LTRLTFKLVPARRFVHLVYEKHGSVADYLTAIRGHVARGDLDFMDGIIHTTTECVLAVGRFVDEAPYTSRYDWMKIYYQSTRHRAEDYLTTPDYFFRYDRGVTNVRPRSLLGRFLFGRFLSSNEMLRIAEKIHWLLPHERPTSRSTSSFLPRRSSRSCAGTRRSSPSFRCGAFPTARA